MKLASWVLIFTSLFVISCGKSTQYETRKTPDSVTQEKSLTTEPPKKTYDTLDLNTFLHEEDIAGDNEVIHFKTVKRCLNDSAVVSQKYYKGTPTNEYQIDHNYSIEVILTIGERTIFNKTITKDSLIYSPQFQRHFSIASGEYKRIALYDIEYHHADSGKLFFKANFVKPGYSNYWAGEVGFTIGIQTENLGKLTLPVYQEEEVPHPDLMLYSFERASTQKKEYAFIKLFDDYFRNSHGDSLLIPEPLDRENIVIVSKYRKMLLATLKISEMDSVFIYNHENNKLITYRIKDLKIVAYLYDLDDESSQGSSIAEYDFGLEVDKKASKNFGDEPLIAIGKESPFIRGEIKPMDWKKIEPKNFPNIKLNARDVWVQTMKKGNAFMYSDPEFNYYVQEFEDGKTFRRLLVLNSKTKETIIDFINHSSEYNPLWPLNSSEYGRIQWAGRLFKNAPPVMFGFQGGFGRQYYFLSREKYYIGTTRDIRI